MPADDSAMLAMAATLRVSG